MPFNQLFFVTLSTERALFSFLYVNWVFQTKWKGVGLCTDDCTGCLFSFYTYASLGAFVGHEIAHAFDDTGERSSVFGIKKRTQGRREGVVRWQIVSKLNGS